MYILINVLLAIDMLVAVLMTLVILMQRPKSEGLGAAFGGGVTENIFGAQTTNVLTKFTGWLAGIFFVLTFVLGILYARRSASDSSLHRELMGMPAATPAVSVAPATGLPGSTPAASAANVSPSAAAQSAASAADAATRYCFPFLGPGRVSATIALIQASTVHKTARKRDHCSRYKRTPAVVAGIGSAGSTKSKAAEAAALHKLAHARSAPKTREAS